MAYKSDINKSILNRNNFRLLVDKIPTVEYYVRTVNIPGVQFGETVQSAGVGLDAFFPGDKATFDTLEVSFLVYEDLGNFIEIYNWIDSIVPLSDPALYGSFTGTARDNRNRLAQDVTNEYLKFIESLF